MHCFVEEEQQPKQIFNYADSNFGLLDKLIFLKKLWFWNTIDMFTDYTELE